jgi:hypothetical protein
LFGWLVRGVEVFEEEWWYYGGSVQDSEGDGDRDEILEIMQKKAKLLVQSSTCEMKMYK